MKTAAQATIQRHLRGVPELMDTASTRLTWVGTEGTTASKVSKLFCTSIRTCTLCAMAHVAAVPMRRPCCVSWSPDQSRIGMSWCAGFGGNGGAAGSTARDLPFRGEGGGGGGGGLGTSADSTYDGGCAHRLCALVQRMGNNSNARERKGKLLSTLTCQCSGQRSHGGVIVDRPFRLNGGAEGGFGGGHQQLKLHVQASLTLSPLSACVPSRHMQHA